MSQKHISLLTINLSSGGAERIAINVANGLSEMGYNVDLVTFKAGGAFSAFLDSRVKIIDLNTKSTPWLQCRRSSPLRSYLASEKPDAVLSFGQKMNRCLIIAASLSGYKGKLIISERNRFTEMFPNSIARFIRWVQLRYLYKKADKCICVSNGVKDDFLEKKLLKDAQATVIYNPVAMKGANDIVSHRWFSEKGLKVILGVGSLNSRKDFETLVRAFGILAVKDASLRLVILGEGSHRKKLDALAIKLKVKDKFDLPGFVPNAIPYIARSSVLVMSSLHEGFGNVLVEALACGTNVVSTECPSGPSEILDNGSYGWLVPVGNAEKMAEAINEALLKPKNVVLLKERAKTFSLENGIKNYVNLIDKTLRVDS